MSDPNCKHSNLIVQRNNGERWVTCTDCFTDFLSEKYVESLQRLVRELAPIVGEHHGKWWFNSRRDGEGRSENGIDAEWAEWILSEFPEAAS